MVKVVTTILILFSSVASVYYSFGGIMKPETAVVYNKAKMSRGGIQLISLFLGIGGLLLLFPQTFKLAGAFLIVHSLITIICFITIKDWRGGFLESVFLQIPVFLVWAGYPHSILEKFKTLFS